MDPNANLAEQLDKAREILAEYDAEKTDPWHVTINAAKLAELVVALDEWIRKGGFIPTDWANA